MTNAHESTWWEVYVRVPEPFSDATSEYLHALGSTAVVFHEEAFLAPQHELCVEIHPQAMSWTVLQGALPRAATLPQQLASLQEWLRIGLQDTPGVQLYCRPLAEDDYLTQWQQFFPPLCVGEQLFIRPPWDETEAPPHMACLTLNPGPAFGTGAHPTTYLCLLMLTQYAPAYQDGDVLDIGCGSGILSLAALQLGWRRAVGIDIDDQAVTVARQNAALNGLQDRAQFLHGSWQRVAGVFSCITANVYLGPLVEMMPPVARHLAPGGTLILAGILASQEATLSTAITQVGLTVHGRQAQDGWVALAARRGGVTA